MARKIAVVLKGYPRLSETFIAQELRGLELAGFELALIALRRPTDAKRHPVHDEITATVSYLPEYLRDEPLRVLAALLKSLARGGFWRTLPVFLMDFVHDRTRNRVRRFGQALVLAAEWPSGATWLHAHFIHTPASVAAYASLLMKIPWTCSAHAKDIWTSAEWDLAAKLAAARWTVTCTKASYDRLRDLSADPGRVHLSYHGLDLDRFGPKSTRHPGVDASPRDGSNPAAPVILLSVGRAVEKKGYDVLLRALAALPPAIAWRFIHIGGGEQLPHLQSRAATLGLSERIAWMGALAQEEVLAHYRAADVFALACRIASDGDRDGLPNVLVEAASQGLACVSTSISGVPELITHGETGLLVAPDDPAAFAAALARLITDPALRARLGTAGEQRVRAQFDHRAGIAQLAALFEQAWRDAP